MSDPRRVADTMGNQNNVLRVEWKGTPKTHKHVPGKILNEHGIVNTDDIRSDTPVEQVATTAAELADIAQKLDQVGRVVDRLLDMLLTAYRTTPSSLT